MILVTGGAGYIGSHTCVELLNAGEKVVVVGVQHGRSNLGGGLPLEAWFGLIYTLRDDLLTRGEAYADPAEALKAVDLAE